ncbi:uncharacterized protein LOC144617792 isoform X4 [Crassostrea virginica]
MTVCSDLFRDILSRHIKPTDLRRELDNNKNTLLRALKIPDHKSLLFPLSGGQSLSAKDMDLTILYALLRNICGIPKHQNGWGNTPKIGDFSLAACIERIREQKNSIASHNNIGEIDDNRFHDTWKKLQNDIVNIESLLIGGDMYERRLNELLSCDFTPAKAIESVEEFKRLYDKMNEVQTQTKQYNAQKKGANASKKARICRLEKQQSSSTSDIKDQLKETEQHILYMVQGRLSGIEERIEGRLSANEQQIGGRLFGIEQHVHGSFSGIQQQLAGCFSGIQQLAGSFSGIQQQLAGFLPKIEEKIDDMKSRCFPLVLTSTIKVPGMFAIQHISVVSPDKVWVSNNTTLQQVDGTGHVIRTLDDKYKYNLYGGGHTVSVEGDLVFLARVGNRVHSRASGWRSTQFGIHKITSDGNTTTLLRTPELLPKCIHSSHSNGDLLIGLTSYSHPRGGQVMRCDSTGKKIGDIELDEEGRRLYRYPQYITENKINGDIVVSDEDKEAIVVVDRSGRHLFDYTGQPTDKRFDPCGVCTDLLGRILVSHRGTGDIWCASLLDEKGNFLTRLLSKQDNALTSLYVDDSYNIYVAYDEIIKVFR